MIPMPVLYGIFLYMGISSLNGIQFMQRLILFFMPEKHQPDYIFLRHVRTFKVHLFTIIQITCLALLFLIKSNKTISILFPIMVLALVGIRKLMDYMFTQTELSYLDDIMPEIVKRSKEDGKECSYKDLNDSKIIQNESINITQEIHKTHIWQDLMNSDKHLDGSKKHTAYSNDEPHPKRTNSIKKGFNMASLKLRKLNSKSKDEHASESKPNEQNNNKKDEVKLPLLSNNTTTSSSNNNETLNLGNSIPRIVIDGETQSINSNYFKNRKEFFSKK
jgi:hypothetical protein